MYSKNTCIRKCDMILENSFNDYYSDYYDSYYFKN